jgi:hypothetical protein
MVDPVVPALNLGEAVADATAAIDKKKSFGKKIASSFKVQPCQIAFTPLPAPHPPLTSLDPLCRKPCPPPVPALPATWTLSLP